MKSQTAEAKQQFFLVRVIDRTDFKTEKYSVRQFVKEVGGRYLDFMVRAKNTKEAKDIIKKQIKRSNPKMKFSFLYVTSLTEMLMDATLFSDQ